MQRHEGGYYVRLAVLDRPGAVAAIATRMAERKISLESIVQRQPSSKSSQGGEAGSVPVVMTTYATSEHAIRAAMDAVMADGHIADKPQLIRIERENV
jgi:homoserine dehydrogenase